MIEKIKVGRQVFDKLIGFGCFSNDGSGNDGSLLIVGRGEEYYAAISLLTGKVYNVVARNNELFVEIPYGGRVYRAPLRFKL
jgi:hypothetical protein